MSSPIQPTNVHPKQASALVIFIRECYAPGLHLAFAAAWLLALDAGLSRLTEAHWQPGLHLVVGTLMFFLVLFYLRVLDEWKDFEYDRRFNPNRPLVRGIVSFRNLYSYLAATASLVFALHLLFPAFTAGSRVPLAVVAVNLVYALALVGIERLSSTVRDNVLLNLVLTYPVNVALSIYAYSANLARSGNPVTREGVLLVTAFACAFLFYEFARKISFPSRAQVGKRLYSSALGVYPALALAILFAACATGTATFLFAPVGINGLAPSVAFVAPCYGAWRFLQSGVRMTGSATVFLVLFYATVLLAAIT